MSRLLHKFRAVFLSHNSSFELTLRTFYHKLAATQLFFNLQNFIANRSYNKFCKRQQQKSDKEALLPTYGPKVTFILSSFDSDPTEIKSTLETIISLHGDNWEVIISSSKSQFNFDIVNINDSRISLVKNDLLSIFNEINESYVVFCEAGDKFSPNLLIEFYRTLVNGKPAVLTYYDCEYFDKGSNRIQPFFKPTASSPALMLSVNYLSRGLIYSPILQRYIQEFPKHKDLLCFEYSMMLNLCEVQSEISHIPKVLLTQKALAVPDSEELRTAVEDHLTRQGLNAVSSTESSTGIRFTWKTNSPSLAIIILSKNNARFLKTLIPSLTAQPYDGHKSIYIVDNGSEDLATLSFYEKIRQEQDVVIVPYPKPFNYSEAINLGVNTSDSDLVLLINDDMALLEEIWLDELSQWAVRPEIGVVGAKLLRRNRTIQHAGIIVGLSGYAGHIYLNAPENYHGLMGSTNWYRNYLAITGACQMIRREVFARVGGYDEAYRLAFGDIAFCLKVYEEGFQNVFSPFARLYHFEGSSRGYETPLEDTLQGYKILEPYLVNDDPYFSQNLTYNRIPKCVSTFRTEDERKQQIAARKRFYFKK